MRERGTLIGAGLLAGVLVNAGEYVLNALLLRDAWDEAMRSLTRPPLQGAAIAWLNVMGFALGLAMIWLHAALRPRFAGSERRAALAAGLTAWLFAYVLGFGWSFAMGLFSFRIYLLTIAWSAAELPLACLAGAWLYDKGRGAARRSATTSRPR